ncbi:MAG TPA: superoxide dismutase [Ni] [Phycisphaerae bacterium]|nr:superoxide dismutase [Ni] [Phycisphaerae bacterium]
MNVRRAVQSALVLAAAAVSVVLFVALTTRGHCQIPCGIYDDPARFKMLDEHLLTIEKSINEITALSAEPSKNANQLTRWIINKEAHADEAAGIVMAYFFQQRIKPVAGPGEDGWDRYVNQVVLCHKMLVELMKTKQTTDLEHVQRLGNLLVDFRAAYLGADARDAPAGADHGHAHP